MYVCFAFFPVVLALILMTRFKVSPGIAMPISCGAAVLTGLFVWKMPLALAGAAVFLGIEKSLDIILIVTGAILLLNVLKKSGAIETINSTFVSISPDTRIQAVIIAWMFSNFIEGASGFGAAPVLAAPILVSLGVPAAAAVSVALICNTLAVPFGAVGTPALTMSALLSPAVEKMGIEPVVFDKLLMSVFTDVSVCYGIFLPFTAVAFMILASDDKQKMKSICEIFPFCVFAALAYLIPWKYSAEQFGPELPSMLGSVVGLPVVLAVLKLKVPYIVPETVWNVFKKEDCQNTDVIRQPLPMSLGKAWLPYLMIALLLVVTRMPVLPIKAILLVVKIRIPDVFGVPGSGATLTLLNNPGVFPCSVIALAGMFFYGLSQKDVFSVFSASFRQLKMASIAIAMSFAMVQIMIFSDANPVGIPGMLRAAADAFAGLFGTVYVYVALLLGTLGTFFAGSCTVSNILFGQLQFGTAQQLGLAEHIVCALQAVGGGLGSMIRISGVVAACATVNAIGQEGRIILKNLIPAAIMAVVIFVIVFLLY